MVSAGMFRVVAIPLEVLAVGLAAALLLVVIPWFVMAMRELGPPARHRARPSPRPASGRGMPIPLGQMPPLPLGPWPAGGCYVAPRPARPATAPMPAVVVAEFDKLRAMIDAGPWQEGPA